MSHSLFAQASEPALLALVLALGLGLLALLFWGLRTRTALLRQVAELEGLSRAGSALVASELDVDALCELIYVEAGQVIDNQTFQVGLFEDNRYHIKVWVVDGRRQPPQSFELSERGGIIGHIRDTRQPLLIHDFARQMKSLPARPLYIADDPPRSAIFLPLISGESVIGALAAQSQQPYRFAADDVRRLTILGNQAASAIANAILYERERTRASQLQLVGEIARQVNAINDLEDIFLQVVHLTQNRFGYHPISIFSVDPATKEIVIQATSGATEASGPNSDQVPRSVAIAAGDGLIGSAIAGRQTVISADVGADERYLPALGLPHLDPLAAETRSEIAIPLIVDGQVLGVLDVHSPMPDAFRDQARTALEALAAQVAIAINKASQLQRQQEQAWMTTAQLQMAEAISRSTELEELEETITRLTAMLLGFDFCGLLLWDETDGAYRAGAHYASRPAPDDRFARTSLGIGRWSALDAAHVGLQPIATEQAPPWVPQTAGGETPTPTVLIPLVAQGTPLGMLVASPPPQGHTAEELLELIGRQAGQALDNALLAIAQQEEAWVNTALLQVAEAVNSLIELPDILASIVRFVPLLVGVNACLLLIWDAERGAFRPGPSHGISDMSRGVLESFAIDPAEVGGLEAPDDGWRAATPRMYEVPLPGWLGTAMKSKRAQAVPLIARGRLVGVLLVGATAEGGPLRGRRLAILAGIAQQAAVAVVNDQLYQQSAERDRLSQELQLAHEIQASMIPPGSPRIPGCSVASYWQAARDVSGDFYDFISLSNRRWGVVIADVADKGMPAAIFMAVSRTVLRAVAFSRISPAATLRRVNDILLNDTTTDLFVTVFYAVWDPGEGVLTYANAGHNPPLLLRADGSHELLRTNGIALGVLESIEVGVRQVRLGADDVVLMYTDGVTEAMNEDFDEFGLERLALVLRDARSADPAGIVEAVTSAVREHAGDAPPFDDLTMVVLKRKPPRPSKAAKAGSKKR